MLAVEAFVLVRPSIICLWIAPSVKEIATFSIGASSVACSFFCGRAVVDNIDFIRVLTRQCYLVQNRVVINAIAMHPIGLTSLGARCVNEVNVEQFGMVCNHAEVVHRRIVILHQMVPCMPTPNDVSPRCSIGLYLDDLVRPHAVAATGRIGRNGRVSTCLRTL